MTVYRRPLAMTTWPDFPPFQATISGKRIYAIGDVHGYIDILKAMMAAIAEDMRRHPLMGADRALVIFLGDLIDRGPDSAGVVEMVMQACAQPRGGVETLCLRGNHDDWLATFLTDTSVLPRWGIKGGLQTLLSYGMAEDEIVAGIADQQDAAALQRKFAAAIPERHRDFMLSLPLSHQDGDYFFAHAGVDPERALDAQRIEDLTWIRDKFLLSRKHFGKVVVHGHTPQPQAESLPNRINVDTGVYLRQLLSCAILEGDERHLLQVGANVLETADPILEAGE